MEKKYYDPDMEEFHVGFEYEYLSGSMWIKHIFGKTKIIHPELDEFNDDLMKIAHANVRVKYLDREDIQDLGWKLIKERESGFAEFCIEKEKYYTLEFFAVDQIYTFPFDIVIYEHDFAAVTSSFNGTIKNKSELKKLMQQLKIENK